MDFTEWKDPCVSVYHGISVVCLALRLEVTAQHVGCGTVMGFRHLNELHVVLHGENGGGGGGQY